MNILENIILAPYTVFKIGGPARYFCEVVNTDELTSVLDFANARKIPFVVFGAGSNILVSDNGYSGLVIRIQFREIEKLDNHILYCGAGASTATVVNTAAQNNLTGFEWAIGIPGTIGGSVFGNAGCFGGEIQDIIKNVDVLEIPISKPQFQIRKFSNNDCQFSYRDSIFKRHQEWIIVGATLKLMRGNAEDSRKKILEYTKQRTATQDIGSQCAGCIFKNLQIDTPGAAMAVSSGRLIDEAGLKGVCIGGAEVSRKHANYIINTGGATAADVRALISLIKEKVRAIHGVELEEEIRYI